MADVAMTKIAPTAHEAVAKIASMAHKAMAKGGASRRTRP